MEKNLGKLVQDEIQFGRSHEVINSFSQSDRLLYESQDFEWTQSGFLMKKKNYEDHDYDWDVLAFCKENPDLAEKVKLMLDGGERLLRQIYTDRESFLAWAGFFDKLNQEGLYVGDYVSIDEQLSATVEDAMAYIDTGFSIETVGERSIYYLEPEEEDSGDWLGDLIDPYQQRNSLPRDKYRTITYVGLNESDLPGVMHAALREERLTKLIRSFNGIHHRAYIAKIRHDMSSHWKDDKKIYSALKHKKITLDKASETMWLTVKQWHTAFLAADKAWNRACKYDEKYFSAAEKKKRQIRSNEIRDYAKGLVLSAATTEDIEEIMSNINGQFKLGMLWKNDYKEVYGIASLQWRTLNSQNKHRVYIEDTD